MTCTKNLHVHPASRMITHSLFSFQRSNVVYVRVLFSSATFISYHIRTNLASTFLSFFRSFSVCLPHRVSRVFLAGIRIYHVQIFYASIFLKRFIKKRTTHNRMALLYIKNKSYPITSWIYSCRCCIRLMIVPSTETIGRVG